MQPDSIQAQQFTGQDTPRQPPSFGLLAAHLPPLPSAARECLGRLPVRRRVEAAEGSPLWLLRLGVTVLPHSMVTSGWLCTIVAADSQPAQLPVGAFVADDVEIVTAIAAATCTQAPLSVQAGLPAEVVRDAWLVRLAVVDPRYRVMAALLHGLNDDTLIVTADEMARRRSAYRTVAAFRTAFARLYALGFLVALDQPANDAIAGSPDGARYGLRLPRPGWPRQTAQ